MSAPGPVPELADRATACATELVAADRVLLVSHIDADGLSSAAIAATALRRAGIAFETVFEKQLDGDAIDTIAQSSYKTVLFTDFGSGQLDMITAHDGSFTPVVVDHHQPADADTKFHLNPMLEGLNGAAELSGAGAAYVLARALAAVTAADGASGTRGVVEGDGDGGRAPAGGRMAPPEVRAENRDLAGLAVIGAVGDMQATGDGLTGANAAIVSEGVEVGVLNQAKDLALYGKQTRPLPKLLEYATEAGIPGVTGDEAGAIRFLESLDIDLKVDGAWRTWVDLTDTERRAVTSGLVRRAIDRGVPTQKVEALVATAYTLPEEPEGTELRDASEFSTLLNATARYERADVGLAVCLGDRQDGLDRARKLLGAHRRNLSEGVRWVERTGVSKADHIQWFDAGDEIRETIVGIVAGMAVGCEGVERGVPIIAFADDSETETKVSARGTGSLVGRGLDLSRVMREAAQAVGGDGGGHDIAAGATIPAGQEEAFVEHADRIVGEQLA